MSIARKDPTGKVFMHGRSQAVRLPKEFRISGKEVRISRLGHKLVLEPIKQPSFDTAAWRAKLRALGAADFLPEGRPEQPQMPNATRTILLRARWMVRLSLVRSVTRGDWVMRSIWGFISPARAELACPI